MSITFPAEWFAAMVHGIDERRDLIHSTAARMAPEPVVVAAAVAGLSCVSGIEVLMEQSTARSNGTPLKRVDVVVRTGDASTDHAFEWKVLWAPGFKECVDGIGRDRCKLISHPRGFAFCFVYWICAPRIGERPISRESLQNTVGACIALHGAPLYSSAVTGNEEFTYQVHAWRALP